MARTSLVARPVVTPAAELFQQALAAHQRGQHAEATKIYQQVLQLWPNHADSMHLLGVVAHQRGEHAVAIDRIGRAIALDPGQAHYHCNLGLALFAHGRVEEAIRTFDAALRCRADYPEVHYNRGNALKRQGRIPEAADCYRKALRHRRNYVEAYNNLGSCLLELGRPERAEAALRRALRIAPTAAEVHNNLGLTLRDLRRPEDAITSFQQALRLRPDFADASNNLAAILQAAGRMQEAIVLLRNLVVSRPEDAAAHRTLATALYEAGRWSDAERHYRTGLAIDPGDLSALHGLAETLRTAGQPEEAEPLFRRLLAARPDLAEPCNDLANALHQLGRQEEAITLYRRAIELKPDLPIIHINLGNLLKDMRDAAAAETCFRTAIALDPENADAHLGLGTVLLRQGRFSEGWQEAEWRFRGTRRFSSFPQRNLPKPRWNGEALGGRTLLLHAEQGFGDSIQFCRYASDIARRTHVVLEVPRGLMRLMTSLRAVETIVAYGETLPNFDLHCPLLSLPLIAGTTLTTIPAEVPYLHAPPEVVSSWQRRLAPLDGLRVGLVWGGNPEFPNDRWRSAALQAFEPLGSVPGVSFVSLQKGTPSAQAATPPAGIVLHDWTAELGDFADTAGLISALDLVISTDTSVPHLAGALGKPVWLLSGYDACWRWLLDRNDSPWYPTLRQFRQQRRGDWRAPVEEMRAALSACVREVVA